MTRPNQVPRRSDDWQRILDAVRDGLTGAHDAARQVLGDCWASTSSHDHAQRCVIAHYLADLQADLDAETRWDERALAAYAGLPRDALAPLGIPDARGLAPSLHLNLGDAYHRQGRTSEAARQHRLGAAALKDIAAELDGGYEAMIRRGLARLAERLAGGQADR